MIVLLLSISHGAVGWSVIVAFPDHTHSHSEPVLIVFIAKSTETFRISVFEPRHEISNNVVCATSKGSDQPAHSRSLIRAFASRLRIL